MATMDGHAGAQRAFDDFRSQGEKLAAFYAGRGATAAEAAKKAYAALVEYGWDIRDNFRVPKGAKISADDAQLGAAQAKRDLVADDLAPMRTSRESLPTMDREKRSTPCAVMACG
jgi:hypothetical protein